MPAKRVAPRIPLPRTWRDCVKLAVLHAIALAHYAIVYARAWAADSINARVRLAADNDRLIEECAQLRKERRIKGFPRRAHRVSTAPLLRSPRAHGDPRASRRPRGRGRYPFFAVEGQRPLITRAADVTHPIACGGGERFARASPHHR